MATRRQARRAVELHQDELGSYPNVVGIGVVDAGGKGEEDHRVAVYVSQKLPPSALEPDELIPQTLEIPAKEGSHTVRTRVVEAGELQLEEFGADSL